MEQDRIHFLSSGLWSHTLVSALLTLTFTLLALLSSYTSITCRSDIHHTPTTGGQCHNAANDVLFTYIPAHNTSTAPGAYRTTVPLLYTTWLVPVLMQNIFCNIQGDKDCNISKHLAAKYWNQFSVKWKSPYYISAIFHGYKHRFQPNHAPFPCVHNFFIIKTFLLS